MPAPASDAAAVNLKRVVVAALNLLILPILDMVEVGSWMDGDGRGLADMMWEDKWLGRRFRGSFKFINHYTAVEQRSY